MSNHRFLKMRQQNKHPDLPQQAPKGAQSQGKSRPPTCFVCGAVATPSAILKPNQITIWGAWFMAVSDQGQSLPNIGTAMCQECVGALRAAIRSIRSLPDDVNPPPSTGDDHPDPDDTTDIHDPNHT